MNDLNDDAGAISKGEHDDSRILLHSRSLAAAIEVGARGEKDASFVLDMVYDVHGLLKGAAAIAHHSGARVLCHLASKLLDSADGLLDVPSGHRVTS